MNDLWEIRSAAWKRELGRNRSERDSDGPARTWSDEDFEILENLYRPPVEHEAVERDPEQGEFNVYRLKIDGVMVRYVEDMSDVTLTVEGRLPEATLARLVSDLLEKLTRLEGVPYVAERP